MTLLRRLWSDHVRRHWTTLLVILLLTAIMAGTSALYPVLIDRAFAMFTAKDSRILYQIPALVIAVMAVKCASQYVESVMAVKLVLRVIRDLQVRLFDHLTQADLPQLEREAPALLASRFTADAMVIRETLLRMANGVGDLLTVIGLLASMVYLNWVLSLICLVVLPLASIPVQYIGRRVRRSSAEIQGAIGATSELLNESFTQARTIRAYRLEAVEQRRARRVFDQLSAALLRLNRHQSRVDPILELLGGAAVAGVIGFAGWEAAQGIGDVGDFTGFIAALLVASRPMRALGSLNATVQQGSAGLARVYALLDEPAVIVDRPHAEPLPQGGGRIAFADVRLRYGDGRVGLDGLTFEVAAGTTVALVGPSGAGKSTALALIPRLLDVSGGAVSVDGIDVRDLTVASLRGAVAYVGQDTLLFDDAIGDNIRLGRPDATDGEVERAAEAASLGFVRSMPDGLATWVGPGGRRLSGGQRQRVALARAFLRDARILLLDEATSSLDTESEAAIQAALALLRRRRTTVIVAHRLSTVLAADLIVFIAEGQALEHGTHDALMARSGGYARLVRSQALIAAA